ncbi:MAG: hypothetical protein K0U93_24535 [Gammaproteobacteria bacterium]|nr:hypothetical protein [Gammaproteobacteria bacterium]
MKGNKYGLDRSKSRRLGRLGFWLLGLATVWYLLGAAWVAALVILGGLLEFSAYFVLAVSEEAEREERWNVTPIAELVSFEGAEMIVRMQPHVQRSISLRGVVGVQQGDTHPNWIGLMLENATGEKEQIFLDTRHTDRDRIPSMIRDHLASLRDGR